MFKFLILLSAVVCALGAALPEGMVPQLDGRIVGGDPTTISEFPWQISLQRNGRHFCGGTIYSEDIIITAAHCLQFVLPSALKVRAGSTYSHRDGVLVDIAAFKTHEGYNGQTFVNDIAVIHLKSPLPMSSTIKSIPLGNSTPADGAVAAVSGWGTTSSGGSSPKELRYVEVDIISNSKCASSTYGYGSKIKGDMLCAYTVGKDSCQGDSGGPMVSGGALVGVVSWGYGCAFENYPGVYTNVASYTKWISKTVSSL